MHATLNLATSRHVVGSLATRDSKPEGSLPSPPLTNRPADALRSARLHAYLSASSSAFFAAAAAFLPSFEARNCGQLGLR